MNVKLLDRSYLTELTKAIARCEDQSVKRSLLQRRYFAGKADGIRLALPEIHLHIGRVEKLKRESREAESALQKEIDRLQRENAKLQARLSIFQAMTAATPRGTL